MNGTPISHFGEHHKSINAGLGAIGGLYLNRQNFGSDDAVEAGMAEWWSGRKECWDAIQILKRIMSYRSYEQTPAVRELVT